MMRIALFLLTNLAVMVVFGLVLSLTGIQSSSMTGLLIMALLFGFGGSIVSLMMSKWMALKSVGGEVIEQPRNETERWLMNTVAQQAQQVGIAMPQVAIYLLPVQFKRSRDPGDSAEMMQARRAFLDAGHYQPLRDAIAERLRHYAPTDLLDIGCGEGYYTHAFAAIASRSWGLDVSKPAIRAAAKRYPQVNFCVASSQRLPFSDASFDAVVRIYAPCNAEELARVVRPGGWVITATPGPRHLLELKGLIYDEVRLHELKTEAMPGFRLEAQQQLAYPMILTGSEAQALLQMTPFAWRAKAEVHAALRQQPTFGCQTDFMIHCWQREA